MSAWADKRGCAIHNSWFLIHNSFPMDSIEVVATFTKNGVFPRAIKLGNRVYKILKVNLVHTIKEGTVRIYFFSVSDEANAWKLGFDTETLKWWVEDGYAS
ncbi:hypothetical protein D4R52_03595 [bacterium]|nr:MAG: hypothetical protein D4R52_03595 [bacterium]